MAGTTQYFGISYPTNTDYVKDGASNMQTIATGFDTAVAIPTYNNQTGTTYTFVLADAAKTVTSNNASAVTFTIPPQSSVAWATGTTLTIKNYGAGAITFAGGSGVTVTNTASTVAQYGSAKVVRTGSDAWTVLPDSGGASGALTLISAQTISSSVSAVNFDNCFTSTYQNYLVLVNVTVNGYTNVIFRYRASNSTISTGYTNGSLTSTTGASLTNYAGGETVALYLGRSDTSKKLSSAINIFNPLQTGIKQEFFASNGDTAYFSGGGNNTNATSMDGFSIIGESYNLTAGTIRIYGIANS